jgi:hypothetical protein
MRDGLTLNQAKVKNMPFLTDCFNIQQPVGQAANNNEGIIRSPVMCISLDIYC